MNDNLENVLQKELEFREVRDQVQEKILKSDSGIDNEILKIIYDEVAKTGNRNLQVQIHEAMYDNRASQRIKKAERVSSSLGEWFNRSSFEDQIKKEGDYVDQPFVADKSKAFEGAPYFSVGTRGHNIRDPEIQSEYLQRVEILTKDMNFQLGFAINRENQMNRTLDSIKTFFGEDIYSRLKAEKEKKLEEKVDKMPDYALAEENFRKLKSEAENTILNPESQYKNYFLKNIYEETKKAGNLTLASEISDVMYDNSALQRIKKAERLSSILGETFNREKFESQIVSEGEIIEKPSVLPKSTVFDDSPHFSVGMRSVNVGKDFSETKTYTDKVEQLSLEINRELSYSRARESRMNRTLDSVKKFFGEDIYLKFSQRNEFAGKLIDKFKNNFSVDEKPKVEKIKDHKFSL